MNSAKMFFYKIVLDVIIKVVAIGWHDFMQKVVISVKLKELSSTAYTSLSVKSLRYYAGKEKVQGGTTNCPVRFHNTLSD